MAIQKASEDTPDSPLASYCSDENARIWLAGIGADDEGDIFEGIKISAAVLTAKMTMALANAKMDIDRMCRIDFDLHEEVDIAVDGDDSEAISLGRWGFVPLTDLHTLSVDGTVEDITDYVLYEDGFIIRNTFTSEEVTFVGTGLTVFTRGRQNIEANITWGYETVPTDIQQACAYMAGVAMCENLDIVADLRDPGLFGDISSVTYGDMKINTGNPSRWERLAKRLEERATKICNRYRVLTVTSLKPSGALRAVTTKGQHFERWSY